MEDIKEEEDEDEFVETGRVLLPVGTKYEEEKQGSTSATDVDDKYEAGKGTEYAVDSDEDMEDEERRIIATARQLNK